MENELVSIIVPVYNVEKYLSKCINSIISQTYKNIEIILVNDGSTDESLNICQKYKRKDKRIVIVNKDNGGLSDARNFGIDKSIGKYITFVDSDDWLDEDTIEVALDYLKKNNADISVYGMSIDNDERCIKEKKPKKKYILDSEKALIYLNSFKGIDCSACNKLYKKVLFKDVRFPVGKLCEDMYTIYKLIDKAKVVTIPKAKYHYYQRQNSITRNKKINMDYVFAAEEQEKYISANRPNIKYAGITGLVFANITIYHLYFSRGLFFDSRKKAKKMKKYRKYIFMNKHLSFLRKMQYFVFSYVNCLYNLFLMLKYKKIK